MAGTQFITTYGEKMITVSYDPEVDMTYVKVRKGPVDKTYSPNGSTNIDVDFNGRFLGVEFSGTPGQLRQHLSKDAELAIDLSEFIRWFS